MTMILWNLTHGQWSNWFFCGQISWLNQRFTFLTMEIRISAMVMVKWAFLWLNFMVKFQVDHLGHGKFGFWPWS